MLLDQSINTIPTFEIFLTARPPEEPASSFSILSEPRDVLSLTAQVILHYSHPIRAPSAA